MTHPRCLCSPAWTLALVLAGSGCNGGMTSVLTELPDRTPPGAARCMLANSQLRPLIVEWESADRAALEVRLRQDSLVAVRYEGCEMELLHCGVAGKYHYSGVNRKSDGVVIENEDDLYGELPLGAVKLEARLHRAGRLEVETQIVGMLAADRVHIKRSELAGDCAEATHVISGAQVGAFRFLAGGKGEAATGVLAGSAGRETTTTARKQLLGADGDVDACHVSTTADSAPPERCGALLRLEMVALVGEPPPPPPPAVPSCPRRSTWDGSKCVPTRCSRDSRLIDGACVAKPTARRRDESQCPIDLYDQPFRGAADYVGARLPRGVAHLTSTLDFNDKASLRALDELSPCRTWVLFGLFQVYNTGRPLADLRHEVIGAALDAHHGEITWSDISSDGNTLRATYSHMPWVYPTTRKGWFTLEVIDEWAYFYVLETEAQHFDGLLDTFRRSAATMTVAHSSRPSLESFITPRFSQQEDARDAP